jgi:hypothetical protein
LPILLRGQPFFYRVILAGTDPEFLSVGSMSFIINF